MSYLEAFAIVLVCILFTLYLRAALENQCHVGWTIFRVIGILPLFIGCMFFLAALSVWESDPYEKHQFQAQQAAFEKCKQSPACAEKVLQLTK